MNNDMKIALVGCGALARIFYLPVLKGLSVTPAAIVDPNLKAVSDLAHKYGITNINTSLEETTGGIDAAIIASPNFLHFPQTKYLLERGKHVLLEKPIASTAQQVEEMMQVSKISSAIFQPGMMRRFWKINRAVKKALDEGVLGSLHDISMQEGSILNWPVESPSIFNLQHALGGVLIDTGSHTLDLLNWWLADENFELQYWDDNRGGVETDCHLEVYFNNLKVKAEIRLSRIRNLPNEFVLNGSKGWIKLKPWMNVFETSDKKIDKFIYQQFGAAELNTQGFDDLFKEQVGTWIRACRDNSMPVVQAGTVKTSIRMIEQSYKNRKPMEYPWN